MNKEKNYISCEAKNCVYHKGEDTCTAERIKVESPVACCCDDTKCSSFKMMEAKTKNNPIPT